MMELDQLRQEIDAVDKRLVEDIKERMKVAAAIADYKREHGIPVMDSKREREVLHKIVEMAGDPMLSSYYKVLYSLLFELSRSYQNKLIGNNEEAFKDIRAAIENTPKMFPKMARVACQGVEGAYSMIACEKLFNSPNIMYLGNFEGVFSAVENGLCEYGILPIENSTAGSVRKVYDLMLSHNFYIVRSTRIKVNHCLIAKQGTELKDVKEIYSHEQAISQCSEFLKELGSGVKLTEVENTAVAAQMVAQSGRNDVAALSSYRCAELYGLKSIKSNVQDNGNNHTRFICISKKPEIYPGANKTSVMMVLSHRPGALYKMLARFYALDINVVKLESRPMPDRDFEFMFYFDIETSVYSEEFVQMISELSDGTEEFHYLGSYSEVM
ncbi:MAG: prephenate dehydratase domain-containing protein [Eubacteriales bacterium]|nr:prephenate dehydratase domain-containing protein [Eubacteriales bacterium]